MSIKNKIAVLGAGNGGTAIAAYLTSVGAEVNLYDPFPQYLEGIQKSGYIELTINGETTKQALNSVTSDVAIAVKDAPLILVVTPAFTHRIIAENCAPYLEDSQIIVLNPGRTGGVLEFLATVRSMGCKKDITVAETQTLIYACRKTGDYSVEVFGVKKEVALAALPANRIQLVLDALHPYYPQFQPAKNCFETSLANIGAVVHPVPILLNIGHIECKTEAYTHYWAGVTPAVTVLMKAVDRERLNVAAAYNTKVQSLEEWLKYSYDTYGDTVYDLIQNNKAYQKVPAPKSVDHRFITEDVPTGLVPISELGKVVNVPTPNIDAVILLANTIYKKDFRKGGRSLKSLGLDGMNPAQVSRYLESGEK